MISIIGLVVSSLVLLAFVLVWALCRAGSTRGVREDVGEYDG